MSSKKYGKNANYNFSDQKEPKRRMGEDDFANMPSSFYMSDALRSALLGERLKVLYPPYSYSTGKQPTKYKVSKAKTTNTKVEPINTKVETAPKIPV